MLNHIDFPITNGDTEPLNGHTKRMNRQGFGFVASSSTPLAYLEENGNTYQDRLLADGSLNQVLRNLPFEAALRAMAGHIARRVAYQLWAHD